MRILAAIFILSHLPAPAQTYYDDAQVRTHLSVEKKLGKYFSVHIDQQNRFTNNVSELSRASLSPGITFKLNKSIKLMVDYVFIQRKNKYKYYDTRHWFSGAIQLKKEIRHFTLMYRNLFQARYNSIGTEDQFIPRYYDRNKFTLKYEATKRYTFYIAEELYVPVNSPRTKGIDRTRSYLGLEITTRKDQQLELYFMFQAQMQNNLWFKQKNKYPDDLLKHYYVYGIKYSINF